MADSGYRIRVTADTKDAAEKLSAVKGELRTITEKGHDIRLNLDANAIRRSTESSREIAQNLAQSKASLQQASGINVATNSLAGAATLATTFYGLRKDFKGLNQDLGKAVSKTNISEFMRTNEFLDRVVENGRGKTKEIAEIYQNVRELPGSDAVLGPVENFARAKAWETYGSAIAQQTVNAAKQGVVASLEATKDFFYGDVIKEMNSGISSTIDTLARLGLAIQGVQLLVGPLAAAWGAAFDAIIGQNVRLQQTILSTQTTLASTGRIVDQTTGQELTDPLEKINALGPSITKAIDNIRIRSLDLAGVTSQQIIDIFGVVSTSIAQVNGDIKDAEDLSISFTAALGTLGIPFYQARQEIGSILGGYITEDSLLAKRLQISNQDIAKAKGNIDGVVGYLKKKLETAVAGQALQAKGFAGVTSNIAEVFEVIAQKIGAPLLKPLIDGLTLVYNGLSKIQGIVSEVGEYISKTIAKTIYSIANIFSSSRVLGNIGKRLNEIGKPFQEMRRNAELGLSDGVTNLLGAWMSGAKEVPKVMEGVVQAMRSLTAFLALQVELVTRPILDMLDMTRERLSGAEGVVQALSRSLQFVFFEGMDAFTLGWDTLESTIKFGAEALTKFGAALIKLKITELTSQIRAAAKVFELFGSLVLGKINLAFAFFNTVADVLSSDFAQIILSITAINKVLNDTETFGLKGLIQWGLQARVMFQKLTEDAMLFVKGFRDSANMEGLLANSKKEWDKLLGLTADPGDAKGLKEQLSNLKAFKKEMAKGGAGEEALKRYSEEIDKVGTRLQYAQKELKGLDRVNQIQAETRVLEQQLVTYQKLAREAQFAGAGTAKAMEDYTEKIATATKRLETLRKEAESLTRMQKIGGAAKQFLGMDDAALQAARKAAENASTMAAGAASAKALEGAMEALRLKLGMTKDEFNSLGGVARAAGESLKQFITTTILVNVVFTAITLALSAYFTWLQKVEEAETRRRRSAEAMAVTNKVLASGYQSIIRAAEGGDIASQRLLETQREVIQNQISAETTRLRQLQDEYAKRNDKLFLRKAQVEAYNRLGTDDLITSMQKAAAEGRINALTKEQTKNKKEQAEINRRIYKEQEALAKLNMEAAQVKQYDVLSERRKDLEDKIAEQRKELEKELRDIEFQARMEVLSLEESKRKEMIEQQKRAMEQQFQILINTSTEQEAAILKTTQQYEQALLSAVDNEESRRSQLTQKQMQLRKEIEDYAWKLAKDKVALEKQIGGYKKQMEEYYNKQNLLRGKQMVEDARKAERILNAFWQPTNEEERQQFQNLTQSEKGGKPINTADTMLALQVLDKQDLRISSNDSIEKIVFTVKALRDSMEKRGQTFNSETLAKMTGYDISEANKAVFEALRREAVELTQTGKYYTKPDPNALKQPNLNIDYAGMEASRAKASESILAAQADLNAAQQAGDTQRIQLILDNIRKDISVYTKVKRDYTSALETLDTQLKSLYRGISEFGSSTTLMNNELENIDQQLRNDIRGFFASKKYITTDEVNDIADTLSKGGRIKTNVKIPQTDLNFINALFARAQNAKSVVRENFPVATASDELSKAVAKLTEIMSPEKVREQQSNLLVDAMAQFQELTKSMNETGKYSLQAVINEIRQNVQSQSIGILGQMPNATPETQKVINDLMQAYAGHLVAVNTAMDPMRRAIEDFSNRLAAASRATDTLFGAFKTFTQSAISNMTELDQAVTQFGETISQEFTSQFLDYALAPLREQIKSQMQRLFGVQSAQERANQALILSQNGIVVSNEQLKNAIVALTTKVGQAPAPNGTTSPNPTPPGPVTVPVIPHNESGAQTDGLQKAHDEALKSATDNLNKSAEQTDDSNKKNFDFGKALSGATQAFGAIAMGIGGAQQMGKGGTYNTLMGLASIFGALGSITGMFGTGGIFAAKKNASGGPVRANRPYIVGEIGPELFMPNTDGEIVSNAKSRKLLSAAALAGKTQTFSTNVNSRRNANPAQVQFDFAYQSEVINNVEYVTSDQFRKGMADSAERGKNMAFAAMQNNVSTRRRLGL